MSETWYDELPEGAPLSETDKIYVRSLAKIREGIMKGLDFETACAALEIADEKLKGHIVDDVLKVFIAEGHFAKGIPLEELGKALGLPLERLEKARAEMFEDIENTAINAYHTNTEKGTEH